MKPITNTGIGAVYSIFAQKNIKSPSAKKSEIAKKANVWAKDSIEIRFNKMQTVKELINCGNYHISSKQVADKIINDMHLYYRYINEKGQ
ncbi:MAG: flagellar biosynthesis anti-sigma factor FlgM [Firmicutes bacterium]|nr:flagellar biosynthesis anti-sigma factor FlgM [Bacillota bacterium]